MPSASPRRSGRSWRTDTISGGAPAVTPGRAARRIVAWAATAARGSIPSEPRARARELHRNRALGWQSPSPRQPCCEKRHTACGVDRAVGRPYSKHCRNNQYHKWRDQTPGQSITHAGNRAGRRFWGRHWITRLPSCRLPRQTCRTHSQRRRRRWRGTSASC